MMSILMSQALASPVEVESGPYKISFDLKTTSQFSLNNSSIRENESSSYMIRVISDNRTTAAFAITGYKQPQYAAFDCQKTSWLLMKALAEAGKIQDPTMTDRQIDGRDAQVQTYRSGVLEEESIVTLAKFWLDAEINDTCGLLMGMNKVELRIEMDRDASQSLLDTLKVSITGSFNDSAQNVLTNGSLVQELDSRCQEKWAELGYSDSIIGAMGYCEESAD
ncbi:MAG TPA: hypothetical protein PK918_02815 [Methanotrichaceae archaeon]|nr:hypothetical protein [Methanotrichaceae archaeon]